MEVKGIVEDGPRRKAEGNFKGKAHGPQATLEVCLTHLPGRHRQS